MSNVPLLIRKGNTIYTKINFLSYRLITLTNPLMDFESHCKEAEKTFGSRYEEIHRWLDEFAARYPSHLKYKHRKYRHHKEGIDEARKLFGDLGALVAEQHILLDNGGWIPERKDYEIEEYDEQ